MISLILKIHITSYILFFFFNDTATTEIYTLSLHDALPISNSTVDNLRPIVPKWKDARTALVWMRGTYKNNHGERSEEHTSELQSQSNLVCRLLLEKKKINTI